MKAAFVMTSSMLSISFFPFFFCSLSCQSSPSCLFRYGFSIGNSERRGLAAPVRFFRIKLVENAFSHDSVCGHVRCRHSYSEYFVHRRYVIIYLLTEEANGKHRKVFQPRNEICARNFVSLPSSERECAVNKLRFSCGSFYMFFSICLDYMAWKRTFVSLDDLYNCSKSSRRRVNE